MKKLIIATALLATTTLASAADMAKPIPFLPPPVAPTWAGFYVGALAGYGSGSTDNTASYDIYSVSLGTKPSGALAGMYAGYNYQFGNWVAGLETDIAWYGLRGSADLTGKLDTVPFAVRAENKVDWLGTTRARIGYALGSVLLYGAGGVAYGGVHSDYTACIGCSSLNSSLVQTYSTSHTKLGWTAGAGLEYLIGGNITARAEYLYYDLGNTTDNLDGVNVSTSHNGHVGRIGLGFKF